MVRSCLKMSATATQVTSLLLALTFFFFFLTFILLFTSSQEGVTRIPSTFQIGHRAIGFLLVRFCLFTPETKTHTRTFIHMLFAMVDYLFIYPMINYRLSTKPSMMQDTNRIIVNKHKETLPLMRFSSTDG